MTEYSVLFAIKMSAKSVKDLERKAEKLGEDLSLHLHKTVLPYQYGELVKKDVLQTSLEDSK